MDTISCNDGVRNKVAEQLVQKRRLPAVAVTTGCEKSALHHAHTTEPDIVFYYRNVSAGSRYYCNRGDDV
jgi:hypothetical protein